MNLVEAVNSALREEMERDDRVMVLGEDVGRAGGVFRATEGLQKLFGEDRVVDTPLAESGIVGTAIGLALFGMRPVAEIQFMGFIYPAFDQIISHAGRMRNRSRGRFSVPLVIRAPYGGGIHAPEHHSESTEAIFAHTPGIKVVIPSNPYDAKGLLISAIRDPDPVVFLEPKRLYRAIKAEVPDGDYEVPIGNAAVAREGEQVTLIAWGSMVPIASDAADALAEEGIDVELIDVRTVTPLDSETIIESVKKTGRVVVVHEAPKTCGFGAEIIAMINERAFLSLSAPPQRVTGFDIVFPLLKSEHLYLPSVERISAAVRRVMEF
ncbi:MAG: alpha-ketoacid dehydrogenase subunit beta [Candidatus Abyssobacteria bacterium SURF_5]|uniref:Alpha-ketoacid dehydrogenase subunit beta n=1 Tax=Abyssobacteria bacterium (strain SURF_5) TaxID=2093360 RepID=A0A3A4NG13_ABYX5|nr:MAG: alpha-ketoacid dehydrogenase subunit beta [Candidatus Abyssubacteria bacterium SURF_5]